MHFLLSKPPSDYKVHIQPVSNFATLFHKIISLRLWTRHGRAACSDSIKHKLDNWMAKNKQH